MIYVSKEHEHLVKWRIPFTVYYIWKDPELDKYRLVVKELNDNYAGFTSIGYPEPMFHFRII